MKIPLKHLKEHETKREVFIKFIGVLTVFILYFIYVSLKFGVKEGFLVAWLTWSFFVLCTPIADAGLLIAFPLRVLLGIRMLKTQIILFFVAFALAVGALLCCPDIYNKTIILSLFKVILTTPIYWIIIILSIIGTIFSIVFGDEMLDVVMHRERSKYFKHKLKHELLIYVVLFGLTIILYESILMKLGVNIPLF